MVQKTLVVVWLLVAAARGRGIGGDDGNQDGEMVMGEDRIVGRNVGDMEEVYDDNKDGDYYPKLMDLVAFWPFYQWDLLRKTLKESQNIGKKIKREKNKNKIHIAKGKNKNKIMERKQNVQDSKRKEPVSRKKNINPKRTSSKISPKNQGRRKIINNDKPIKNNKKSAKLKRKGTKHIRIASKLNLRPVKNYRFPCLPPHYRGPPKKGIRPCLPDVTQRYKIIIIRI